jgi:hypothetical protein
MKRSLALSSLALLSLAVAFLSAARAADPTRTPNPGVAKKVDWEHMSFDERKKLMKMSVFPELKKAFQAFNSKRYKTFTCATCHGDGATDGKFKMPNAALPKLPTPGDHAAMTALQQKKPEAFKFMETAVKPKVSELIGVPGWTPQNPKGVGCYTCHTFERAK